MPDLRSSKHSLPWSIFAIVSLAITSLMVMNTRMISENVQSSEAVGYAQELLENLREVPVARCLRVRCRVRGRQAEEPYIP